MKTIAHNLSDNLLTKLSGRSLRIYSTDVREITNTVKLSNYIGKHLTKTSKKFINYTHEDISKHQGSSSAYKTDKYLENYNVNYEDILVF